MQTVLLEHWLHGLTQFTHTSGTWVVSGYMYTGHSDTQVLVVLVLLRYLYVELVSQRVQ